AQPEVIINGQADTFVETADFLENVPPHDAGRETDEIVPKDTRQHPAAIQVGLNVLELPAVSVHHEAPAVDDADLWVGIEQRNLPFQFHRQPDVVDVEKGDQ